MVSVMFIALYNQSLGIRNVTKCDQKVFSMVRDDVQRALAQQPLGPYMHRQRPGAVPPSAGMVSKFLGWRRLRFLFSKLLPTNRQMSPKSPKNMTMSSEAKSPKSKDKSKAKLLLGRYYLQFELFRLHCAQFSKLFSSNLTIERRIHT